MIIDALPENPTLRVLSLGAGVQSTVLALMASKGETDSIPDCAIFSDTGGEPDYIYKHLDWLKTQLNFPVHIVQKGNLEKDTLDGYTTSTGSHRYASIPFFLKDSGINMRQCTFDYKIQPVQKKIRELLGLKKGQRVPKDVIVETWIGISLDEIVRAKRSPHSWNKHRWILLEKEMRRHHCLEWFNKHYPNQKLAKSSCYFCPFHDDNTWRDMKLNDPKSFNSAVNFDKKLRKRKIKFKNEQYLHRSCKPLDEVNFDNLEDQGQYTFLDECEGMCGV